MHIWDQTNSPISPFSPSNATRSYHQTNEEPYGSPTDQPTNKERKGKDPVLPSDNGGSSSTMFRLPTSTTFKLPPLPKNAEGKIDKTKENEVFTMLAERAYHFFNRAHEPKESRLVDFPEFRGGNQDLIEWLESFERACIANRVSEERRLQLVGSYLKGTALSWFSRQTIHYWDDDVRPNHAFVQLFRIEFYNPFRIGQ